jgi:cell division protein ZapA
VAKVQEGITVEIYDQEYHIKGDLDPEYIQKLAKYLDAKMRSIAGRTRTVDSLRVAVLAALNLADEYHQLKVKHEAANEGLNERVRGCTEVLDRILKQAV